MSPEDIKKAQAARLMHEAGIPPEDMELYERMAQGISSDPMHIEEANLRDTLGQAEELLSLHASPEELVTFLTQGVIGLQWLYTAKAHDFQDVIRASVKGSPYYIPRHENWVIEQHPFVMRGTHHIEIGAAEGDKPVLLTELYGAADHYTFFDVSADYLNKVRERLIALGVPPQAITCCVMDYTSDKFWPLLGKVIQDSHGKRVTINAYGNEVNNESLAWFLKQLRPLLPPKAQVRIGGDNTQDDQTLLNCYLDEDFGRWQMESATAIIRNDAGYDIQKPLIWLPTVTPIDGGKTVNFQLLSAAGNQLTRRLDVPRRLKGLPRHLGYSEARILSTGHSNRYTADRNIGVVHEEGYNLSPECPGQPLRVKNRYGDSKKIDCNIIVAGLA